MIKNLIAAAMASILITQPPQNTNDGTYYQDVNITESYEYETNEVNSVDDLVVGNIYKFSYESETVDSVLTLYCSYLYNINIEGSNNTANITIGIKSNNDNTQLRFLLNTPNVVAIQKYTNGSYVNAFIYETLSIVKVDMYFVYLSGITNDYINNVSASDYLGEKTITIEPVETEGLYNLAYHFLYSRIYTNTELQGMETTLFGTTINMNMWLSHTTAIVIICLLLVVLIKFVLWLFKIVSGGMLWK